MLSPSRITYCSYRSYIFRSNRWYRYWPHWSRLDRLRHLPSSKDPEHKVFGLSGRDD
jgi:hypothetical protein